MKKFIFCALKGIHKEDDLVFLNKILNISALKRFDYGLSETKTKYQTY